MSQSVVIRRFPVVHEAGQMALVQSMVPEIVDIEYADVGEEAVAIETQETVWGETESTAAQDETDPNPYKYTHQTHHDARTISDNIRDFFTLDVAHHRQWSVLKADSLLKSCDFDRLFQWQSSPLNQSFTTQDKLAVVEESLESLEASIKESDSLRGALRHDHLRPGGIQEEARGHLRVSRLPTHQPRRVSRQDRRADEVEEKA